MPDSLSVVHFTDMLDLLPDGVVYYEAVRDHAQTIVDFQLVYYNRAFRAFAPAPYKLAVGVRMLTDNRGQEATLEPIMQQYVRTVETGEVVDYTFYDPNQQATVSLRAKKMGDGVLVTTRDVSARQVEIHQIEAQTRLFDAVLNASLNGIITYMSVRDETGKIIDFRSETINEVAARVLFLPDKTPGWLILQRFPGVGEHKLFDQYVRVVETGEPMRFETQYENDGVSGWYDVAVVKLGDGFVITFNDITRSRQAQQQVEEQSNLLRGILNTSLNGMVVYEAMRDEHGTIRDFRFRLYNHTARADILARIGRDIANQTLLSVYPDSHESGLFELYARATETGKPIRLEHHYPDIDIWYDVSLAQLDDGCVVTFIDITQLKKTVQRVEEQADFVSKLLDGSLNGLVSLDPVRDPVSGQLFDLRILSANKAAQTLTRRAEDDLIGRQVLVLYPQIVEMGLFALFESVLETRQPQRIEAHLQTDPLEFWLDVAATPRDNEGLVVSFLDITERKIAQQRTNTLVQELQKTNANLEQFAYVASHDLQEPLRKVTAFGDIVRSQYAHALGPEGTDLIGRMQSATLRMQTLIKDLLAYSRVANMKESFRPVNLNLVIADVLNDLELVIADKKADIAIGALPTVNGDAVQLHQLFQNLISNSLKFSQPAVLPHIRITADLVRGREFTRADGSGLLPESLANRGFHRIQVIDNGIGFDPQYADRIFQVFQRLHTRNQYSGTGIGLSIVQKVVDNHRGFISAEGRLNNGATFVILLPVKSL